MLDLDSGTNAQKVTFDLVIGHGARSKTLFVSNLAFNIANHFAHLCLTKRALVFGAHLRSNRQIGRIVDLLKHATTVQTKEEKEEKKMATPDKQAIST